MSRHRNVRNLTHDDYYDDYDDYDDDYYEEDDDYYYEQQQERREREKQEQQLRQQAAIPTKSSLSSKQAPKPKPNSGPTCAEKERTLLEMNFTKEQAKWALSESNGDLQGAVNALLNRASSPSSSSKNPAFAAIASTGVSHPPPGFTKPAPEIKPISKPTSPPTVKQLQPQQQTQQKLSLPRAGATLTPPKSRRTDYGALPKIPDPVMETIRKQRSRLSMVVLGHVDAGKSTLMGQVLVQLGQVQKRTVTKFQKQAAELGKASFALAWVMDEDDSERERGVTMEVATKYAATDKHDIVILDAPGHSDFIPAMITGAASADVGLLVIAATPGEFEAGFEVGEGQYSGGQTREHVILARGLGVSQLIVAVNKLDAAEPHWSEDRFNEIKARLLPFLQANGFQPKRIRFVPISGLTGVNVKDKASVVPALAKWYNGPTLLESIDSFASAQRNVNKPMRFIVTDAYAEGKGVSVRGRVVQGVVQVGEKVVVLPIGDDATVTRLDHGLMSDSSPERLKFAVAGDSVELFLMGIDVVRLSPGCVLSHPHIQLRPPVQKKMQAKILVMEELGVPIIRGATVLLHMHSIDVPAVLSKLIATTNRDGSIKKERPRVLTGGASATVEITLNEKICMEEYSDCRALGRFVLRRGGDTIALGIIEKILGERK